VEQYTPELTLADYLAVLRRRWALILAVGAVIAGAAYAWSATRPNQYRAQTQILMSAQTANQTLDPTASQVRDVARQLENELVFARSRVVRDAVTEKLGYGAAVNVAGESRSADLLTFTATGFDPERVARAADTYAETFIEMRTQRIVSSSAATRRAIDDKLLDLKRQRSDLNPRDASYASQVEAIDRQITLYEQYTNGLDLMGDLASASNAQVLSAAVAPATPFSPTPVRTTMLAAVVGLMLGVGLSFLLEFLDDRIRSKEDLERVTGSATTLALVPKVSKRMNNEVSDPLHAGILGETFRNLRAAVQFVGLRGGLRTIQVTSSRPSEGKSTVAGHLAVAMARSGSQVVLVDADLRRPMVANRFGLPNTIGLTNVMLGQESLDAAMQEIPECPGLYVITSGPSPENAADFLWPTESDSEAPTFPAVLAELVGRGFTVIVDAPPVLPVADALTIARAVDGTLFVTTAGVSGRRDIARALESLGHVDARVIGTVLNRATERGRGRYGYGYGYGYGPEASGKRRPWNRLRRRSKEARPAAASRPAKPAPRPAPPVKPPVPPRPQQAARINGSAAPTAAAEPAAAPAVVAATPAPAAAEARQAVAVAGAAPIAPVATTDATSGALLDNLRAHLGLGGTPDAQAGTNGNGNAAPNGKGKAGTNGH